MAIFDPGVLATPGTIFLEDARPTANRTSSWLFSEPEHIWTAHQPAEVPATLSEIDDAVSGGAYVAGYLAYEAGYAFGGDGLDIDPGKPLLWLATYDDPVRLSPADVLDGWSRHEPGELAASELQLRISESSYRDAVNEVRRLIFEGDVYQINFTTLAEFSFNGSPIDLYQRLRAQQRVSYGAYINTGDREILSLSPELFFHRDGRQINTKPMKGTIGRGRTLEEDGELATRLSGDPKSQAENLMIVDLLRNDLSRVCEKGSVAVPALFSVEAYESVHQMTSTVSGTLREGVTYREIVEALFPCGSVTGAPKLRAMKRIHQLEHSRRGAYCGAIGYISPKNEAVFSVAIRTLDLSGEQGCMGTGSGIVWDSDVEEEYRETLLKTRFLRDALSEDAPADLPLLIETMRCEDGEIALLNRHLDRLERSSKWMGYPLDRASVRAEIMRMVPAIPSEEQQKVRLTLDSVGRAEITTSYVDSMQTPIKLMYWSGRVDSEMPFLYHKTTRRQVYSDALREARERKCDEAILINEDGYVTEGTRTNIFIRKGDMWHTSPLSCGLLPGVYRSYLLDTLPAVKETPLTVQDLEMADEIVCCNALRGKLPAMLASPVHLSD